MKSTDSTPAAATHGTGSASAGEAFEEFGQRILGDNPNWRGSGDGELARQAFKAGLNAALASHPGHAQPEQASEALRASYGSWALEMERLTQTGEGQFNNKKTWAAYQAGAAAIPALAPGAMARLTELADELDAEADSGAKWTKAQHTCVSVAGALRDEAAKVHAKIAEDEDTIANLVRALREATESPTFMGEPVLSQAHPGHAQPEPVLWVSPEQMEAHDPQTTGKPRYLPALKRPEGLFTIPLYATPPTARQEPAAVPADTTRLDWLAMQCVTVRTPLRYGSRANFISSPDDNDGELLPSDLRNEIDGCLAASPTAPPPVVGAQTKETP